MLITDIKSLLQRVEDLTETENKTFAETDRIAGEKKQTLLKIADTLARTDPNQLQAYIASTFDDPLPNEDLADYIIRIESAIDILLKECEKLDDFLLKLKIYFADQYEQYIPGHFKNTVLEKIYQKYVDAISEISTEYLAKILPLRKKSKEHLLSLVSIEPNTLVLFIWYFQGNFKINNEPAVHIGLALRQISQKPTLNDETIYLSVYENRNIPRSSLFVPALTTDGELSEISAKNHAVELEEDLYRLHVSKNEMSYWRCEKIEIKCDRKPSLDLTAMMTKIRSLKTAILQDSLGHNCASIALQVLEAGGAYELLKPNFPKHNCNTVKAQIRSYVEALHYFQESKKYLSASTNSEQRKNGLLSAINSTIKCLEMNLEIAAVVEVKTINELITILQSCTELIYLSSNDEFETNLNLITYKIYSARNKLQQIEINKTARKVLSQLINNLYNSLPSVIDIKINNIAQELQVCLGSLIANIVPRFTQDYSYINFMNYVTKQLDQVKLISENPSLNQRLILIEFAKIIDELLYQNIILTNNAAWGLQKNLKTLRLLLGRINQLLFFDIASNSLPEQYNTILQLRRLLSLQIDIPFLSVHDQIMAAIEAFKSKTYSNNLKIITKRIYKILKTNNSWQEKQILIQRALVRKRLAVIASTEKNTLHVLNVEAELIAIHQAFTSGDINLKEFTQSLQDLAMYLAVQKQRKLLLEYVENIRIQAYVDGIYSQENSMPSLIDVKRFIYLDAQNHKLINLNDALQFSLALPENVNERRIKSSSYRLLQDSMQLVFSHPAYCHVMQEYDLSLFKNAMGIGFNRDNKDTFNQKLAAKYHALQAKSLVQTLSSAEVAFMDIYDGIELITKLSKTNLSHTETQHLLHAYANSRKKIDKVMFREMNVFYKILIAVAETKRYHDEIIISQIENDYDSLRNVLQQFTNNLTSQTLAQCFLTLSRMNHTPMIENKYLQQTDGELLWQFAFNSDSSNLDWQVCVAYWESIKIKLGDHRFIYSMLQTLNVMAKVISDLKQAADLSTVLIPVRKHLKNYIHTLQLSTFDQPNELLFDLQCDVTTHLEASLAVINKIIYLENPRLKRKLCHIFNIDDNQYQSIDALLAEAQKNIEQQATEKRQITEDKLFLLELIINFINGRINEKEFHHQLYSYCDDQALNIPGGIKLNWLYQIMHPTVTKDHSQLYFALKSILKTFTKIYIQLEAARLETKMILANSYYISTNHIDFEFSTNKQRNFVNDDIHPIINQNDQSGSYYRNIMKHMRQAFSTQNKPSIESLIAKGLIQRHTAKRRVEKTLSNVK